MLICLSVATLYILRTPKSYTRMMSVLIKSDQQDYNGAMGDFADIGLYYYIKYALQIQQIKQILLFDQE